MMEKEKILEYANTVVKELGKSYKGKRTLPVPSEEADNNVKCVVYRGYDGFGFEIAFLEESEDICAICFDSKLVFSTVCDKYDPDRFDCKISLFESISDSSSKNYAPGYVYIHGAWEDALEKIALNTKKIKQKLAEEQRRTEESLKAINKLNSDMLKYLNFKYLKTDCPGIYLRMYMDSEVCVKSLDEDNLCKLEVYLVSKKSFFKPAELSKLVFSANEHFFEKGPWYEHILALIQKEKERDGDLDTEEIDEAFTEKDNRDNSEELLKRIDVYTS